MYITPAILQDYLVKAEKKVTLFGDSKVHFKDVRLYLPDGTPQPDCLYLLSGRKALGAVAKGFSVVAPVVDAGPEPHELPRDVCLMYVQCDARLLFNLLSECFFTYDEWYRAIYEAIAGGESMEAILEKCYPMLCNPFFIDDSSYRTLARLKDYPDGGFMDGEYIYMQQSGHHSAEYIYAMLNSSVAVESSAISPKPIIHKFDFLSHRTLYSTIKVDGEIVGFFSCLEVETPFTSGSIDVFESLTELMSLALSRESSMPLSRQKGLNNDLYLGVLNGNIRDPELVSAAFTQLGLAVGEYYIVYVTTNIAVLHNPFLLPRIMELLVSNLAKGSFAVADGANIILVVNGRPSQEGTGQLLQRIRFYLREYEVSVGVSMGFENPRQMPLYYNQALAATKLGPGMGPFSAEAIYRYADIVEYDVLHRMGDKQRREAICHPAARTLHAHDREKNTNFIATLKAYILCLGDTSKAADMLFLHRNSLYYRLKQIVDLTGIDLHDGALLFHILLSICAMELNEQLPVREEPDAAGYQKQ